MGKKHKRRATPSLSIVHNYVQQGKTKNNNNENNTAQQRKTKNNTNNDKNIIAQLIN